VHILFSLFHLVGSACYGAVSENKVVSLVDIMDNGFV